MQVTKEQVDPCTFALTIEVTAEAVNSAFDRTYKDFGRYMSVPGFRPGKAPKAVVIKYADPAKVLDRVRELLAGPSYQEALKQEEITPYADPEVEFDDLAQDLPWKFKVVVPTAPKVTLSEVEGLEIVKPEYTIEDRHVDTEVNNILEEYARIVVVEGRGIEMGDMVVAEMLEAIEGEEPPTEPRKTLIRVGQSIPGFDDEILGMTPDETRSFSINYPDDHQDTARAGKKSSFTVTVSSINAKQLPELTDEWVKEQTGQESVESLKAEIRNVQTTRAADISEQVAEGRILDQLIATSELLYPAVMVESEFLDGMRNLSQELESRGRSYEEYLLAMNVTEEQFEAQSRAEAEMRVKGFLVLSELARKYEMQATRDEMAEEFARQAMANKWSEADSTKYVRDRNMQSQVANAVIRRKLRAKLLEVVNLTTAAEPID